VKQTVPSSDATEELRSSVPRLSPACRVGIPLLALIVIGGGMLTFFRQHHVKQEAISQRARQLVRMAEGFDLAALTEVSDAETRFSPDHVTQYGGNPAIGPGLASDHP
jgi:hypothetical protein